jgi:hypothetical protein
LEAEFYPFGTESTNNVNQMTRFSRIVLYYTVLYFLLLFEIFKTIPEKSAAVLEEIRSPVGLHSLGNV